MDAGIYTIPPGLEIAAAHRVVARKTFYRCRGEPIRSNGLNYEPTEALVYPTNIINKWLVIGQEKIISTIGPGIDPDQFLNQQNWSFWYCDGHYPDPETQEPVYFSNRVVNIDDPGNITIDSINTVCLQNGLSIHANVVEALAAPVNISRRK